MNEILLRRKNKVILGTGTARVANDRYITAIMKNIEELGYTFSWEVFDVLRTYSVNELSDCHFLTRRRSRFCSLEARMM